MARGTSFVSYAALFLTLITSTTSQQAPPLPPCAITCGYQSIGKTGCSPVDFPCLCQQDHWLTVDVITCAFTYCTPEEYFLSFDIIRGICSNFGLYPIGRELIIPDWKTLTSKPVPKPTSKPGSKPTSTST